MCGEAASDAGLLLVARGVARGGVDWTYLWIKCKPLAVSTMPEISPGCNAKAASSNSFCMSPWPKYPRSPLFRALLQSDSVCANSSSVISLFLMRFS
jgi:hypothetical protein